MQTRLTAAASASAAAPVPRSRLVMDGVDLAIFPLTYSCVLPSCRCFSAICSLEASVLLMDELVPRPKMLRRPPWLLCVSDRTLSVGEIGSPNTSPACGGGRAGRSIPAGTLLSALSLFSSVSASRFRSSVWSVVGVMKSPSSPISSNGVSSSSLSSGAAGVGTGASWALIGAARTGGFCAVRGAGGLGRAGRGGTFCKGLSCRCNWSLISFDRRAVFVAGIIALACRRMGYRCRIMLVETLKRQRKCAREEIRTGGGLVCWAGCVSNLCWSAFTVLGSSDVDACAAFDMG